MSERDQEYYNHTLQTNPRPLQEEPQNTNSQRQQEDNTSKSKFDYYVLQIKNNQGADPAERVRRLVCAFFVCTQKSQVFREAQMNKRCTFEKMVRS